MNWAGITFVFRMQQETGATLSDVARAWFAAREIFEQTELRARIAELDNKVSAEMQTLMLLEARKLVERATRWLLRFGSVRKGISSMTRRYAPGVKALATRLPEVVDATTRAAIDARLNGFTAEAIPAELSLRVAGFEELSLSLDIVDVAGRTGVDVAAAAAVHFELGAALGLHWIRDRINDLPRDNRWQTLARTAMREDLNLQERQLACAMIQSGTSHEDAKAGVAAWLSEHEPQSGRCREFMDALMHEASIDTAMVAAALREVRGLTQVAAAAGLSEE